MTTFIERAKQFLFSRTAAYRRVFSLNSPDARIVLKDLARFCRAHESTGHADSNVSARLDGRREVWLRIQAHLQLSDDELWNLHKPQ